MNQTPMEVQREKKRFTQPKHVGGGLKGKAASKKEETDWVLDWFDSGGVASGCGVVSSCTLSLDGCTQVLMLLVGKKNKFPVMGDW